MKELSIEEKAKRYDEAYKKVAIRFGSNVADEIFPELKESEDERIRKTLIKFFEDCGKTKSHCWNVSVSKIIAWLEKQGEHANFRNKIQIGDKVTRNEDGVLVNLSQLKRVAKKDEKQGEQKPVIDIGIPFGEKDSELQEVSYHIPEGFHAEIEGNKVIIKKGEQKPAGKVEAKFKAGDTIRLKNGDGLEWTVEEALNNGYYTIVCADRDGFIQLDDNWELVEQKPTDNKGMNIDEGFKNALGTMLNDGLPDRYLVSEERIKESAELLFSIARKQLKNEMQSWSEEDEEHIHSIISTMECCKKECEHATAVVEQYDSDLDWLKSLKDRVQPKQKWDDEHLSAVRTKELIRAEIQKQKQNLIDSVGRTTNKELNSAHHILCVLESFINTIPEKSIEWTEDDENKVTLFMQLVEGCDNYEELSNWLKSLRPQPQWKPSDEQMKCLDNVKGSDDHNGYVLNTLYNDLKKLREEEL